MLHWLLTVKETTRCPDGRLVYPMKETASACRGGERMKVSQTQATTTIVAANIIILGLRMRPRLGIKSPFFSERNESEGSNDDAGRDNKHPRDGHRAAMRHAMPNDDGVAVIDGNRAVLLQTIACSVIEESPVVLCGSDNRRSGRCR